MFRPVQFHKNIGQWISILVAGLLLLPIVTSVGCKTCCPVAPSLNGPKWVCPACSDPDAILSYSTTCHLDGDPRNEACNLDNHGVVTITNVNTGERFTPPIVDTGSCFSSPPEGFGVDITEDTTFELYVGVEGCARPNYPGGHLGPRIEVHVVDPGDFEDHCTAYDTVIDPDTGEEKGFQFDISHYFGDGVRISGVTNPPRNGARIQILRNVPGYPASITLPIGASSNVYDGSSPRGKWEIIVPEDVPDDVRALLRQTEVCVQIHLGCDCP